MKHVGKFITAILILTAIFLRLFYQGEEKPGEIIDEILSTVKENSYLDEEFYMEGDFLRYGGAKHMIGIDVSTHQGEIDWQQVADSGVEFAILRAGYRGSTKGDLYEDEYFAENFRGAKKAGIKVGVYFFSQALNEEEAREEARYLQKLLKGKEPELPVFYDWEYLEGRVPSARAVPMTEMAVAFCEEVQEAGLKAGVYFNRDYGDNYLDLSKLQSYTLWLAEYANIPRASYHFHCLQYTDRGTVPGIEGKVDLDLLILP